MQNNKELQNHISEATYLQAWIHDRINERTFPESNRNYYALTSFQHAQDNISGSLLLMEHRLSGVALALTRPTLENFTRGVYILHLASDDQIKAVLCSKKPNQPGAPKFESMLQKIENNDNTAKVHDWLIQSAKVTKKAQNDLTHGGKLYLLARIHDSDKAVEPRYPIEWQLWLISMCNEVQIQTAKELFGMLEDSGSISDLNLYTQKSQIIRY